MLGNILKTIEKTTCFSQSYLWSLVHAYYQKNGEHAWDRSVPYVVTNALSTAKHHIQTILSHAKGEYAIIDYGAGIGQHSYYLAKLLKEHADTTKFTIYMADISPKTLSYWNSHPLLKPFIQSGLIKPILLSGNWQSDIQKLCTRHPQHCLITNYLLDSMPFIAFSQNKQQGLSLHIPRKHQDTLPLSELKIRTQPLYPQPPHPYPKLQDRYQSIEHYTIPTTAIDFVNTFFQNTTDSIMIINDKCFLEKAAINYDKHFNLTLEGCFSTTVNLDALLFSFPYHTTRLSSYYPPLQTIVLSHTPIAPNTQLSCGDIANLFQFYKQATNIPAQTCISLSKSFSFDPFCLEIVSQAITKDITPHKEIEHLIQACLANQYQAKSFALLHAAKILRKMEFYKPAFQYLQRFQSLAPNHPAYHLEYGLLCLAENKHLQAETHFLTAQKDPKTQDSATKALTALSLEKRSDP